MQNAETDEYFIRLWETCGDWYGVTKDHIKFDSLYAALLKYFEMLSSRVSLVMPVCNLFVYSMGNLSAFRDRFLNHFDQNSNLPCDINACGIYFSKMHNSQILYS